MNAPNSHDRCIRKLSHKDILKFTRFYLTRSKKSNKYFSPFPFGFKLYLSAFVLFLSNYFGRLLQIYRYSLRIKSYLCVDSSGEAIGFAFIRWQSSNHANLGIAVKEEYSGRGIGSQLMNTLISQAKASDLNEIHLQVHVQNTPAIKLYKQMGFEIVESMEVIDESSGTKERRHQMVLNISRELD